MPKINSAQKDWPKKTILLIGPPNVGKSVIFNHLTGLSVGVANYPGTTVEFAAGNLTLTEEDFDLIDVPGTYTLNATNEAERVAVKMLAEKPAAVICVLDACNLESSIFLLLQVLSRGLPTVAVLNRCDLAQKKGYEIDWELLSKQLGIPIFPTVAVSGSGLDQISGALQNVLVSPTTFISKKKDTDDVQWADAEQLSSLVQSRPDENRIKEKRELLLIRPWPGLGIAIFILLLLFGLVIGLGMGLRQLLLPLFRSLIIPVITAGVEMIFPPSLFREIMVGEYGFLVKGLEWPFTLVLPYVLSFYTALTLLEDSGYMPRLGALVDGLLSRIGLHGSNIIPLLLGYGCGIPGILATRSFPTRKERITVSIMICLSVPCIAQTGAFISLLAERSVGLVAAIFLVSLTALACAGLVLDLILPGSNQTTPMEIPELLWPRFDVMVTKVWSRLKAFFREGVLPMVAAVGVAAFLYETGLIIMVGRMMSPLVTGWLHLPEEAAVPLLLGIMRRELTVLPLLEMELSSLQLFTGAVVGLFYVPCIAMIAALTREFKLGLALIVLFSTFILAFLLGGIVANLGMLF